MLTADLAFSRQRGDKLQPQQLRVNDQGLLDRAAALIGLFTQHEQLTRADLDSACTDFVGDDPQYRVLRGWVKLLTDRCEFDTAAPVDPAVIREVVFRLARQSHPASGNARAEVLTQAAQELRIDAAVVESHLYGDLPARQQLISFDPLTPAELLDRYNLAQAQAILYRCQALHLTLEPQRPADHRRLFEAVKQYRLIHSIQGSAGEGYRVTLDGPVSLFHRSQKYGIQMAVFLPALLLCRGWKMRAEIGTKAGIAYYELDSTQQHLRSHYIQGSGGRPDLDRLLAANGSSDLSLCHEVIDCGGGAWVPDLVASSATGEPLYIELLGFWTPRNVERQIALLKESGVRWLLCLSEELRCSREAWENVPANVALYKASMSRPMLEDAIRSPPAEIGYTAQW